MLKKIILGLALAWCLVGSLPTLLVPASDATTNPHDPSEAARGDWPVAY